MSEKFQTHIENISRKTFFILDKVIDSNPELISDKTLLEEFGFSYDELNKNENPLTETEIEIDAEQIAIKIADRMSKYSDSRLESESESNLIDIDMIRKIVDLMDKCPFVKSDSAKELRSKELEKMNEMVQMYMIVQLMFVEEVNKRGLPNYCVLSNDDFYVYYIQEIERLGKILDQSEYSTEYEKFEKILGSFVKRSKSSKWIECIDTFVAHEKLSQLKTWIEINSPHIDKSKLISLIDAMVMKLQEFNFTQIEILI